MKSILFSSLLIIVIILNPNTTKLYGKTVSKRIDKITILKERRRSLKVNYQNKIIKIPRDKISNNNQIDSTYLVQYCREFMHGQKDARTYDETGFGANLAGFATPGVCNLFSFIFSSPKPKNNKTLNRWTTYPNEVNSFAYKKGYKKAYRRNIQNSQLEGTTILGIGVGSIVLLCLYLQNEDKETTINL